MDAKGREDFWRVLNSISDDSPKSLENLRKVSIAPEILCRYRTVSENSLQQLQDNKLYFSTANYYDDPFDTYFKINFKKIQEVYDTFKSMLSEGNYDLIKSIFKNVNITVNSEQDIQLLNSQTLDVPKLNMNLMEIRNFIQSQICSICFCENPLNDVMWMKYAGNHKGFVQVYNFNSSETFLCGKEEKCAKCGMFNYPPYPFPVYYSDEKYDATTYALGLLLTRGLGENKSKLPNQLQNLLTLSLMWQKERASLIKKKCHQYDEEWRLLSPVFYTDRPCIKLKPESILIGLRTPDYETKLIISAAKVAGINKIYKVIINNNNDLDKKLIEEV